MGNAMGDTGSVSPASALNGTNATADMNANPPASVDQKALIVNSVTTSCGSYTFPMSAHENKGYYADEWARYVASQDIVTYTVGVLGSGCQAEYSGLLTNMASMSKAVTGEGQYFPTTDVTTLTSAFNTILTKVQAVNSVFASVSLPASVNTQGTYINNVFTGMFRPDSSAFPRWYGNLKQYKIGRDSSGNLILQDANSVAAIGTGTTTGFIDGCARSYWTPASESASWQGQTGGLGYYWDPTIYKRNCSSYPPGSDTPDGNIVEKGAAGYRLHSVYYTGVLGTVLGDTYNGVGGRPLKTCDISVSPPCPSLTDFNTNNTAITQTLLSASDSTDRTNLIRWMAGRDVYDEDGDGGVEEVRRSVANDVIHSRPVAVNYGTNAAHKIVVFYGDNGGVFHAVNGNRTDSTSPDAYFITAAGNELWGFIPPEFYSSIKRLRDDTIPISFYGSTTGTPKPYGIDGPVAAYQSGTTVWIYASLRRGGRAIYAFDASNVSPTVTSTSLSPQQFSIWKKGVKFS